MEPFNPTEIGIFGSMVRDKRSGSEKGSILRNFELIGEASNPIPIPQKNGFKRSNSLKSGAFESY